MKTLITFADKYDMLPDSGLVLAAVSGGADSMCLLAVLSDLSARRGFSVAAAHYNHHLRGAESDRDEAFVEDFCRSRNIPCYIGGGDVLKYAQDNSIGTEEAARIMRYDFLYETSKELGARAIATAHTADDNAETVIMNLTRGAGLRGLCGIPPVRDIIIRPLLAASRDDIISYLSENNIPFVEDSTNAETIYTRNMIRHNVIPHLKKVNPNFADAVFATTQLLQEDEQYLMLMATRFIEENVTDGRVNAQLLSQLPPSIGFRVVRTLAETELSHKHVASVMSLCTHPSPSASLDLPAVTVYREYENLVFSKHDIPETFSPVVLSQDTAFEVSELGLIIKLETGLYSDIINNSLNNLAFNYDKITGNIVVRPRQTGDKIDRVGSNGSKSLKKLFIEKQIPLKERALVPVFSDDSGVIAVYGFGIDKRVAPRIGDKVIILTIEEIINI